VIVAAVAAVSIAAATAVRELVRDDEPGGPSSGTVAEVVERTGSVVAAGARHPMEHRVAAPDGWRIRYQVATPGSIATEDVIVRPPFESHTEIRVRGEFSETRETALGVSVTKPVRANAVALAPVPEAAGFRPGPIVAGAVERGVLVRREQRTVAGRRCQVYRTSGDLSGLTFAAPPETGGDHVDVCVDGDGLLLELVEFVDGDLVRQRVALSVRVGVEVSDGEVRALPHEQTIPPSQGGGSVRPIDPASQPVGRFVAIDQPPAGFSLLGRFEVIPPQPDIARPDTRGRVVAGVSDVFVRGGDLIVVERGARLDQANPWEPDERFPSVDLGGDIGEGELLLGVTGGEVRALLGDGRFVRVYGTVPVDDLIAVARSLRQTDGGTGPVYLDE